MAAEASQYGPREAHYVPLTASGPGLKWVRSPIKGYLRRFDGSGVDLIEAVLSPILTDSRWIYLCENLQAATAYGAFGCPLPRRLRVQHIRSVLLRDNCKRVIFWSQAGQETLYSYGALAPDDALARKSVVVYPAVRQIPNRALRRPHEGINLLFSGDFFRKGGVNVVDAFVRLRQTHPSVRLLVCCDERIDFNTPNTALRTEYLEKLRRTGGVVMMGRINRERLVAEVLPEVDVYLLPTYAETFGMSVLEAMAFAIPVIATNVFAIPEVIDDEKTGLLIDTSRFDCERLFRGYVVNQIPADFREFVTEQLFTRLARLVESAPLRDRIGTDALRVARTRFSFEARNQAMSRIYREALAN